jgi:hypothetical protein
MLARVDSEADPSTYTELVVVSRAERSAWVSMVRGLGEAWAHRVLPEHWSVAADLNALLLAREPEPVSLSDRGLIVHPGVHGITTVLAVPFDISGDLWMYRSTTTWTAGPTHVHRAVYSRDDQHLTTTWIDTEPFKRRLRVLGRTRRSP